MKYKIKKGLIFEKEKIGNRITIFDPEKSTIYTLNLTGSYILSGIKRKKNTEEIVALLKNISNAKKYNIYNDVVGFMKQLEKKGLIIEGK